MVGELGLEPRFTESESAVLPIGRFPIRTKSLNDLLAKVKLRQSLDLMRNLPVSKIWVHSCAGQVSRRDSVHLQTAPR